MGDSTAVQLAGSRSHGNAPCSSEPAPASSRSAAGCRVRVYRQAVVMDRPGQESKRNMIRSPLLCSIIHWSELSEGNETFPSVHASRCRGSTGFFLVFFSAQRAAARRRGCARSLALSIFNTAYIHNSAGPTRHSPRGPSSAVSTCTGGGPPCREIDAPPTTTLAAEETAAMTSAMSAD